MTVPSHTIVLNKERFHLRHLRSGMFINKTEGEDRVNIIQNPVEHSLRRVTLPFSYTRNPSRFRTKLKMIYTLEPV